MNDPDCRALRAGILYQLLVLPLPYSVLMGPRLQRTETDVRVGLLELAQARFDIAIESIRPGVVEQLPVDVGVPQGCRPRRREFTEK